MPYFLISGLLALAVAVTATTAEDTPPYKITTKRNTDRVKVLAEKKQTVFIVKSPFGISNAGIERTGEKWPDSVVLRLHLKGLEGFKATNDKLTLEASVSSQDGNVRLWKDDKED